MVPGRTGSNAMTEAEWLACEEPVRMLAILRANKTSERKLRLLICGLARQVPVGFLTEENVLSLWHAEEFADGNLPLDVLNAFRGTLPMRFPRDEFLYHTQRIRKLVLSAKKNLWRSAQEQSALTVRLRIEQELGRYHPEKKEPWKAATRNERILIGALIRDVFDSSAFRPQFADSAWLTSTVVSLARAIYGDELFPVGYRVPDALRPGLRGRAVAVVDDAINAGSAVRGTFADLHACGARPAAVGALLVLGDAASAFAADRGVPLERIAHRPSSLWAPAECPLCAAGRRAGAVGPGALRSRPGGRGRPRRPKSLPPRSRSRG
jgi:hypothetical protein